MHKAQRLEVGNKKILHTLHVSMALTVLLATHLAIFAVHSSKASASLLSEEFNSQFGFPKGAVVSIEKENPQDIELTTLENSEYVLGVVVNSGESLVTFSKESSSINVSLSGETEVFVSDANGLIKKGDFVGASWLQGVGMKALTEDRQKLVGIALEDYDGTQAVEYGEIETPNGNKVVNVDTIRLRLFDKEGRMEALAGSSGVQNLLERLAGKEISLAKVLAGAVIFLMTVLISGLFIISSIRGSFISIGRNPLASASIYRSLIHVSGLSILIILIGTALSYVVLVV